MPRTSAITNVPLPGWGALEPASPRVRAPASRRGLGRLGSGSEVIAGALLVVVWAMLWAFFLAGVVEPAAGLGASAAAHPSLVPPALPDDRPGAGPGPVDTTGRAP